ncbi:MAG: MBL fold metallo-hydrolase [Clostridia bacterium]|nr:MBL fold metallo-hydrolase [Clostridia bacterium]
MAETSLYLQTETSPFMMSIVLVTSKNRTVVIDGGRPEDMPLLREIVGDREIGAWILTHPHLDHISGFTDLVLKGDPELVPKRIYYNFPPLEFVEKYEADEAHTLREFLEIEEMISDRTVIVKEGDSFDVDELSFTVLQSWDSDSPIVPLRESDHNSVGNESSLIFRIDTPGKSVLILGDAGPLAGDRLFARHMNDLDADIVQVAHHGHGGVGAEIYIASGASACLWCCPDWLYDEEAYVIGDRLCGTAVTRRWLEKIGIKENYVTKDGTHKIVLASE